MTIAFANHKGGTGKTTSVINLGSALSSIGKKILIVDLDPQGNLSYSLGLSGQAANIADLMQGKCSFNDSVHTSGQMDVITADGRLYEELEKLSQKPGKEFLLKKVLAGIKNNYDFILLDCPPAISLYTINAFNAADGVIIPLVFEILSIQGLDQILKEISRIQTVSNPDLQVVGVLGVIVNESRKLSEEVLNYVRDNYQVNIFNNHIRNNVKAAEAPSFGVSVIEYAPNSTSAKDYINVSKELLAILTVEKNHL